MNPWQRAEADDLRGCTTPTNQRTGFDRPWRLPGSLPPPFQWSVWLHHRRTDISNCRNNPPALVLQVMATSTARIVNFFHFKRNHILADPEP